MILYILFLSVYCTILTCAQSVFCMHMIAISIFSASLCKFMKKSRLFDIFIFLVLSLFKRMTCFLSSLGKKSNQSLTVISKCQRKVCLKQRLDSGLENDIIYLAFLSLVMLFLCIINFQIRNICLTNNVICQTEQSKSAF